MPIRLQSIARVLGKLFSLGNDVELRNLSWLSLSYETTDKMAFAGPLSSEDGKTTVGSLLVMEFSNRADVDAWLEDEPFTKAGVYEKPIIHVFNNGWQQKVGFPPA